MTESGEERPEGAVERERDPKRWVPFGLAALSGTLHFLSFCGFGVWPLVFVCFLPLFLALDHPTVTTRKRAALVGLTHGFVAYAGGYHWLVAMLEVFSGYGKFVSAVFASVFWLYLGLLHLIFAVAYHRVRERGWHAPSAALVLLLALELFFPTLFPSHLAYGFYDQTWLIQAADLGGPGLVSGVALLFQIALYTALRRRAGHDQDAPAYVRRLPIVAVLALAAMVGYGAYRTHEVDERAARAETWNIGIVQVAMRVFEKHLDPVGGFRKHLRASREMEATHDLDLIVWPESAYLFYLNDDSDFEQRVMRGLQTPLLVGALRYGERDPARAARGLRARRAYNSAFLIDENNQLLGRTDKVHLLAFGEYLPLGDTFPALYELSPNTGMFSPGERPIPMEMRGHRITTLICYEDVLPGFTRRAVNEGRPEVMINITNDAWFGKTQEPHIHLAMARFRAAEHHLALVRSTNSGVSAFIDPAGRVVRAGGLFTNERLTHRVPLMDGGLTLYGMTGDWPGWISALLSLVLIFRRRGER